MTDVGVVRDADWMDRGASDGPTLRDDVVDWIESVANGEWEIGCRVPFRHSDVLTVGPWSRGIRRQGDPTGRIRRMHQFLRFQSAVPNRHGSHPGFFALVKGLEQNGRFTAADRDVWAQLVQRSYALHSEPPASSYELPGARSWFRSSAVDLHALARDACAVLDRYEVPWMELRTSSPGHVVYEDELQVVAVPFRHPDDWPFRT